MADDGMKLQPLTPARCLAIGAFNKYCQHTTGNKVSYAEVSSILTPERLEARRGLGRSCALIDL